MSPSPLRADHRLGSPVPRRVLVFRALKLGDMLCSVPALRALRAALPRASITLVGLPWGREFARRYVHYVDDFLEFPGHPDLPEQAPRPGEYQAFLRQVRSADFDLAVQMHGSGERTNAIVESFGARRMVGFIPLAHAARPRPGFAPFLEDHPEVLQLLRLVEFLGIRPRGAALEFPVHPYDHRALQAYDGLSDLRAHPFAVIHPGASSRSKCWPPRHFAAVGDALARQGLRVVLTGVASEEPITREVARRMRAPALDVAVHSLPLGPLAALLERARILVSNDTGVAHLGVALHVASVIVFSQASPVRWGPLDRQRHRVVVADPRAGALPVLELLRASPPRGNSSERSLRP